MSLKFGLSLPQGWTMELANMPESDRMHPAHLYSLRNLQSTDQQSLTTETILGLFHHSLGRSEKQKKLDAWYHLSMSTYQTDSRIDAYIQTLPGWQQELCRQVRDLVHAADPDVTETIKRTRQPYFTLHGNICALLGAKDHLTIFIYDPIVSDPEGIINQGQGNLTARAIQVHQNETINQRALLHLFQAIIAHNRAGGWRKLKGSQ